MDADNSKKKFYEIQANTIIKKLASRHMQGFYASDIEEAKKKVLEILGDSPKSVAYGGSMTIDNTNLKEMIKDAGHELVVRENAKTPEEVKEVKARQITADSFIMSTNAITLDGELINIDGRGNRVCYLTFGPDEVIVIAGMNKVVRNVDDGIRRVRNVASPANCVRLGYETPCSISGVCADCIKNTICANIVITRSDFVNDRIKVILVGEELGY